MEKRIAIIISAVFILTVGSWGLAVFLCGVQAENPTISDFLYATLFLSHMAWGAYILSIQLHPSFKRKLPSTAVLEILLFYALMLFLFSYIFAQNANMDYVQRFAEGKESLRIAPDSRTERLNSLMRYAPFIILDISVIVILQIWAIRRSWISLLALPLSLLSSVLYTFSLPSFVSIEGIGILGFFCLVPLFVVFICVKDRRIVLYGTVFGVIQTMLTNFWLGTFSLVSLQVITVLYLLFYLGFAAIISLCKRYSERYLLLLLPVLWVMFDYFRSTGFFGYPWGMIGVSQYKNIPFVQMASITGIWGVSLLVIGANAAIAWWICSASSIHKRLAMKIVVGYGLVLACVYGAGRLSILGESNSRPDSRTIALVQQNTDPRKDDYAEGLRILKKLTDQAMESSPDLVAWSETAFVPNIRRWSKEDPVQYYYARLVREFLEYQQSLGTWLITGNDDYELVESAGGEIDRFDYNASVFFDPEGRRVETYRKIHLVPFTEYFPFKEQLPGLYKLLLDFDVYLWEPGTDPIVFIHPNFTFSTPICFEDGFPRDIRRFIRAGADLIINLSNDYWSLSEVEAKQHFANSVFRAIENRREFLRASASGVTCHVDKWGRLKAELPLYEEAYLIADVDISPAKLSLYTILGDWLPLTLTFCCFVLLAIKISRAIWRKNRCL